MVVGVLGTGCCKNSGKEWHKPELRLWKLEWIMTKSRDILKAVQIWFYNKLTRFKASNERLSFFSLASHKWEVQWMDMSSGTASSDNVFRFLFFYISWIFFILRWFPFWEGSTLDSEMIPRIYRFANSLFQWKSIALLPLEFMSVQLRDPHWPCLGNVPTWTIYWIRLYLPS